MAFVNTFVGAKVGSTSFFAGHAESSIACPANQNAMTMNWKDYDSKNFQITVVYPAKKAGAGRTQKDAYFTTTYFTKYVPYNSWFAEQQQIQKSGGKILKVKLVTGNPKVNLSI